MIPEKRQSVTFGDKNTWDDWKILPSIRPVFTPPTQKTNYIDIPGGDGKLDLTESLTGYPVYNNREGEIQFIVMNGYKPWQERYSEIMGHLHGQHMRAVLNEDPEWFYEGRFEVKSWESGQTWSLITIGYNVGPYKWAVKSSMDSWEWDPFNFDTDFVWSDTVNPLDINTVEWVSYNLEGWQLGDAPFKPVLQVSNASSLYMEMEVGDTTVSKQLTDGEHIFQDIVIHKSKKCILSFTGHGNVALDFRIGRL